MEKKRADFNTVRNEKKSFVKNGYGYEKTRTKDSKGKNNFMMSSCYIQMYVCGYVWWAST